MTKKISLFVLAVAMLLAVMTVSAFAEFDAPEYESRQMTAAEIEEFFDDGNAKYKGDLVGAIYDALEEPDEVLGMVYTAKEDYATVVKGPYANYIVDFELVSKSDVSVLLVGNYGEYGTIPLGIVNLKADTPINVMETAGKIPDLSAWSRFTYADIVLLVKEFKCVAIPLTEDVLKAYHTVALTGEYNEEATLASLLSIANPLGEESFEKVDTSAPLTLGLDLYETVMVDKKPVKTGVKHDVGTDQKVTYYPEVPAYDSHEMTKAELDQFFADGNAKYNGDMIEALYGALEDPTGAAFGIVYSATEEYATAAAAPYANYVVDFEICSKSDMSVLLIGNYGEYGTIPAGIVNLKANEPIRVMDTAKTLPGFSGWVFTYKDVVLLVKEFKCVAVPLTEDVLKAYHSIALTGEYDEEATLASLLSTANPTGVTKFEKVENATDIGVGIDLYETEIVDGKVVETGVKHDIGEESSFVCYPTVPPYESKTMTKAELDAFFADPNTQYNGQLVEAIYSRLSNPEASVYGMNFKSVEDYETALNAPYAYDIPEFVFSSDKDISVILMGNYEGYHTIPMGIINVKANEPVRVVKLLQQLKPEWKCDYLDAVLTVKDFNGAAMLLSSDVIEAIYKIKCENDEQYLINNPSFNAGIEAAILEELANDESINLYGASSFAVADTSAVIGLDVVLYKNDPTAGRYSDTGESYVASEGSDFEYVPVERPEVMQKLLIINNMAAEGRYNRLNVCAAIDSLKYTEVGFKVTVIDTTGAFLTQTQTIKTMTVYNNMKVTNAANVEKTYSGADLGGQYVFGCELRFNATNYTNANTKVVITPYAIDLDGNEITGKQVTISDAIIKNKMASSALFRN